MINHSPPTEYTLASIVITVEDVKNVIRNLNVNKACGPDLISPRLLKEGATIIALPLSITFNRVLEQGYFPHMLEVRKRYPYLQERWQVTTLEL